VPADLAIIRLRRLLAGSVRALEAGQDPAGQGEGCDSARGDEILTPGPRNMADVPLGCEDALRDASESCPGGCIRPVPFPLSGTPGKYSASIPRAILQTFAGNLPWGQGRLDTGPQRINQFGTAAPRQVMLMGASKTTTAQAVARRAAVPRERPSLVTAARPAALAPAQRSRLFNLTAAIR